MRTKTLSAPMGWAWRAACAAVLAASVANLCYAAPREVFTVKSEDGRDEMRFACGDAGVGRGMSCDIRSTKIVVPDPEVETQYGVWSRQLAQGGDSLMNALCGKLQLIEPRVQESTDIVADLRSGCNEKNAKKLARAYASMDSLSKKTCIILNREELLTFGRLEQNAWAYRGRKTNECLDGKTYILRNDAHGRRMLEKTLDYSASNSVACKEERFIDKSAVLKQMGDGHAELPNQCKYFYLD